jgi:hypothetical protein
MNLRFYIDPETDQPHIYNHHVDEDEVEDIMRSPGMVYPGRDNSKIAIGQTQSGRYLRIVYKPDPEPDSMFIITAYELRGKALVAYRRGKRRKSR